MNEDNGLLELLRNEQKTYVNEEIVTSKYQIFFIFQYADRWYIRGFW